MSASKEGYVSKMQVGNIVMTGSTFARILGLNSSDFKLEYMDSGVKVTTIGAGDGMGVSVYTAQNMAKEGASYEDILKTFFNEAAVLPVPDDAPAEIPRIIIKTLNEHAQLIFHRLRLHLKFIMMLDLKKEWDACARYLVGKNVKSV